MERTTLSVSCRRESPAFGQTVRGIIDKPEWADYHRRLVADAAMRISFDVDDTLVLRGAHAQSEPTRLLGFLGCWCGEPLRRGTGSLMRELRRRGCAIWIYTSSGRTPFGIRLWLLLHGIRIDGVINDERHRRALEGRGFSRMPSKYPPAFGIDLHVDDSEGVRMEGDERGFRVLVVNPRDEGWAERVLEAIQPGPGVRFL